MNPEALSLKEKYRPYIIPSIRRVYIPIDVDDDEDEDAPERVAHEAEAEVRRGFRAQIVVLSEKVDTLERDRALLMDRCEAAQHAAAAHAQGERDERLSRERLEREMRELRKKYEGLKGKYKVLKTAYVSRLFPSSHVSHHYFHYMCVEHRVSRHEPSRAPLLKPSYHLNMKRTSTQASLDSIHHLISSGPDSQDEDAGAVERPPSRMMKRPRLLGSPFDLAKRIESRQKARRVVADDYDDDEDATLHESDLSSSIGPQHSGLPRGDIFSPNHRTSRSGRASLSYGWLMTPEDE